MLSFTQAMKILYSLEPVLGSLISRCDLTWDKNGYYVKTAAVGISKNHQLTLLINPEYFYNLVPEHQVGLLIHESFHILLKHLTYAESVNMKMANIAMDVEIDQNIEEKYRYADPLLPLTVKGLENCDDRKDWLYYYNEYEKYLKENPQPQNNQLQLKVLGISDSLSTHDQHLWNEDEEKQSGLTNSMKEQIIKSIVDMAVKDAQFSYGQGMYINSDYLKEKIKILLTPSKIRWEVHLNNLFGNLISMNPGRTYNRPNKKLGYIAPGIKDGTVPSILIFIDESGSHDEDLRLLAFNQVKKIIEDYKDEVICYAFADGIFEQKDLFEADAHYLPERKGFGGTSFIPIFEQANKHEDVDAIFILTDGDGRFPAVAPDKYKVIWGLTNGDRNIPFGTKVVIK